VILIDETTEGLAPPLVEVASRGASILLVEQKLTISRRLYVTKSSEAAYGLWGAEAMDGLDYQAKARAEW
jgi:hypothetical protein